MALITKTLDELHAIALGAIRAEIPEANTTPGSDYDTTARMVAALAMLQQAQAQSLALQIFPESSDDDFVQLHAARLGPQRQLAAKSIGKIQVTASAGTATQAVGSLLEAGDGTQFETSEAGTIAEPGWAGKSVADGSAIGRILVQPNTAGMNPEDIVEINGERRAIREVITSIHAIDLYEPLSVTPAASDAITPVRGKVIDFIASATGASGNKSVGEELTFDSPATGVDATARILECSGGGDDETFAELRARCVDHESGSPGGGNVEHVRSLARTTPGIRLADAVVFPGFRGLGTIDVIPIGLEGARVVGQGVCDLVRARLESELPYAADIAVFGMPLTVAEFDVTMVLEVDAAYAPDFVSVGGVSIAATPASTTTRIYTASLLSVAEVGDRVLVTQRLGSIWKTLQRTITSIQSTGGVAPFWIDVTPALPIAPESTDPAVYPGGPLAEPVIAAIEALFDSLGPSRRNISPAYTYERHPLPSTAWDDTLRRASIHESVMSIEGVHNVLTLTSPASDQQPGPQEVIRRGKIIVQFQEA